MRSGMYRLTHGQIPELVGNLPSCRQADIRLALVLPYSTDYKPKGDLPYISSEQGDGLIIHHGLIMRITIYKPIQEL